MVWESPGLPELLAWSDQNAVRGFRSARRVLSSPTPPSRASPAPAAPPSTSSSASHVSRDTSPHVKP
eukprot:1346385-Rhodomonas_salina.3